jgi:DNA primase
MSNVRDLLTWQIYPAWFEQAATLLPEFGFRRYGRGWQSTTGAKVDGSEGETGKVHFYANNPGHLIDYTRGPLSLWDYIARREKLGSARDILRYLAEAAGVNLPVLSGGAHGEEGGEDESEEGGEARHTPARRLADIREAAQHLFTRLLEEAPEAEAVRRYLRGERGYAAESIRAMGLGFCPPRAQLERALIEQGFNAEAVREALPLPRGAGESHPLSLPWRDASGEIRGFVFRMIEASGKGNAPKYLYSAGLVRNDTLFHLSPTLRGQEALLVEGVLDALHAEACELPCLALGGTSLNEQQARLIARTGLKSLTLCLDNDKAGKAATLRIAALLRRYAPRLPLFIATLPDGVKDVDESLRRYGAEAFLRQVFHPALPLPEALAEQAVTALQQEWGEADAAPYPREAQALLAQAAERESILPTEAEKLAFRRVYCDAASALLHLPAEEITAGLSARGQATARETIEEATTRLLSRSRRALEDGEAPATVLAKLKTGAAEAEALLPAPSLFAPLLTPLHPTQIAEGLKRSAKGMETFIPLLSRGMPKGENLSLPRGAISIFAAPTSHGKTAMQINLALDALTRDPAARVHLFSYEEAAESIALKCFNSWYGQAVSRNNRKSLAAYIAEGDGGFIKAEHLPKVRAAWQKFSVELLHSGRLAIHYADWDAETLTAALRFLHRENAITLACIDYMQLLKIREARSLSRQEELKRVCLLLKECAVDTGLPLVLGAQFNREVTCERELSPTKIGEAGDIERVASLVVGMWNRNFKALTGLPNEDASGKATPVESKLALTVLKHREGEAGLTSLLDFDGNTGRLTPSEAAFDPFE